MLATAAFTSHQLQFNFFSLVFSSCSFSVFCFTLLCFVLVYKFFNYSASYPLHRLIAPLCFVALPPGLSDVDAALLFNMLDAFPPPFFLLIFIPEKRNCSPSFFFLNFSILYFFSILSTLSFYYI